MDQGQFKGQAQAVRSKLARRGFDLGGAGWVRGNAERVNGKAEGLSDRNTFYMYDTDERGSGLEENLRLMGKKCLRRRMGGRKKDECRMQNLLKSETSFDTAEPRPNLSQ
jgi:hypothetical protein